MMAKVEKRKKALSVSPLKVSQAVGATLAFLGFRHAIPMMHGSQGCTAFGKVFFVRHFREPIPLQTSAMDQVSSVMGSEDNVIEGLRAICGKSTPALIGVPTTGLSETQGCDIKMAVKAFRRKYPCFNAVSIVPVSTPDYVGCMETGFAAAIKSVIDVMVPSADEAGTKPGQRKKQLTILSGSCLTPGDLEALKDMVELFGLHPVLIPDLSDSLDGHLADLDFSPLTMGGTSVPELATLGCSVATLVVGASMYKAADLLEERTGVPDWRFDHLMGLDAVDGFVTALAEISGEAVPKKLQRSRARLQDTMLDSHFMLGMARIAIAADPDLLNALSQLLAGMGAETVAAVSPVNAPVLNEVAAAAVRIGDLEELELLATENAAEMIISNSHAAESAMRLDVPLLRAGFPQYDFLGGHQRVWIGYGGTQQTLVDLANILLSREHGEVRPYRSIYTQKPEIDHVVAETAQDTQWRY